MESKRRHKLVARALAGGGLQTISPSLPVAVLIVLAIALCGLCFAGSGVVDKERVKKLAQQYRSARRDSQRETALKELLTMRNDFDSTNAKLVEDLLIEEGIIPDVPAELQRLKDQSTENMKMAQVYRSSLEQVERDLEGMKMEISVSSIQRWRQLQRQKRLARSKLKRLEEVTDNQKESYARLFADMLMWEYRRGVEAELLYASSEKLQRKALELMIEVGEAYSDAESEDPVTAAGAVEKGEKALRKVFKLGDVFRAATEEAEDLVLGRRYAKDSQEKYQKHLQDIAAGMKESQKVVVEVHNTATAPCQELEFFRREDQLQRFSEVAQDNVKEAQRIQARASELMKAIRSSAQAFDRKSFLKYQEELEDLLETVDSLDKVTSKIDQKAYEIDAELVAVMANELAKDVRHADLSITQVRKMLDYYSDTAQRWHQANFAKAASTPGKQQEKEIGGVELNYAEEFSVSESINGIVVDPRTSEVTLVNKSGENFQLKGTVQKDMMDALVFLHSKYGDISQFSFSLDSTRDEVERCQREANRYFQRHVTEVKQAGLGTYEIPSIAVALIPRFSGGDYGDTIVGKIVLDADLALKYLQNGLDPRTHQPFHFSEEYRRAVDNVTESQFLRLWLYLKSARLDRNEGRITVDVDVGIKSKSIKYVSDEETVDIGEAPDAMQRLVKILEDNYEEIAKRVPSWKALKELYKGIAVIQLMEVMGVSPDLQVDERSIRRYPAPDVVDGLVGYYVKNNAMGIVAGGVNLSLRNEFNRKASNTNNFWPALYRIAAEQGKDSYWKAVARFLEWKIDDVIRICSDNIGKNPDDWKLINLLGNAYAVKGLGLGKPVGWFNPELLRDIIDDSALARMQEGHSPLGARTEINSNELSKALRQYNDALKLNPFVPRSNMARLQQVIEIPGDRWRERALAAEDDKQKLTLHRRAADAYLKAGAYTKAVKELLYLCDRDPDALELNMQLTRAYMEVAKRDVVLSEEEPRRVLLLPLKNATGNPQDEWLSKGLSHILYQVSAADRKIHLIDPAKVEEAKRVFHYEDEDLYQQGIAANSVANLYDIRADYIVSASFMKFGDMIKTSLSVLDRKSDRANNVEVKGNLRNSHGFIDQLYDQIVFEVCENVSKDVPYDWLPRRLTDLQVWCTLREYCAKGDYAGARRYSQEMLERKNEEALLSSAEIALVQRKCQRARSLLRGASLSDELEWRRYELMGQVEYVSDNMEKAQEWFEKAVQLNPRAVHSLEFLRDIYPSGEQRYQVNEKLVEQEYPSVEPYLENVESLLEAKQRIGALRTLNQLLRKSQFLDLGSADMECIELVWKKIAGEEYE